MGDLVRAGLRTDIIQANPDLYLRHAKIQLGEKDSQVASLKARILAIETVELEKLKLQLSVFEKEQEELREQVRSIATEYATQLAGLESGIVDAEFTVKPDSKG